MNQQAPETLAVEDTLHFVKLLNGWHGNKIKLLQYMMTIPEGSTVEFGGAPDEVMKGDLLRGFQLGLSLSISELGTLPFIVEMEDEDGAADATATAPAEDSPAVPA
jgi:hypothetical protein